MMDPRDIHAADQLGSALRTTARVISEYIREYQAQGIDPDLIAELAIQMQRDLTRPRDDAHDI